MVYNHCRFWLDQWNFSLIKYSKHPPSSTQTSSITEKSHGLSNLTSRVNSTTSQLTEPTTLMETSSTKTLSLIYNTWTKSSRLWSTLIKWMPFSLRLRDKVLISSIKGKISFYMTSFGEGGCILGSAAGLRPEDLVYTQYR